MLDTPVTAEPRRGDERQERRLPTRYLAFPTILAFLLTAANACRADSVRLHSGGEIRGRILDEGAENLETAEIVRVETPNGTIVTVPRHVVDFIVRRPIVAEQFEIKLRTTPSEVTPLWDLAEWCRAEGLDDQRAEVLNRILDLDPEHERAHYGLGHRKRDGRWVDYDAYMRERGYVRHEGRYVIAQELAIIEESEKKLDDQRRWYGKIRVWHGWLTGEHERRRETALGYFQALADSAAVPALRQFLADDQNPQVRALYLDVLARLDGQGAAEALAVSALMDSVEALRERALAAIRPEYAGHAIAAFVRELKNESNVIVRRAGFALGQLGTSEVVPYLMDALSTTHRYKVTVPGNASPTYSFAADGSFPNASSAGYLPPEVEQMLRSGQLPNGAEINYVPIPGAASQSHTVTIRREERNPEVLEALVNLTGRDFGYDLKTWKLWWMSQKVDSG